MNADESDDAAPDDVRANGRSLVVVKSIYAALLLGIVISACWFAPADRFADGEACGLAFVHMLLATLCLSVLLLRADSPNVGHVRTERRD